jgi:secondary thiamine-phosphate synthase enzyme
LAHGDVSPPRTIGTTVGRVKAHQRTLSIPTKGRGFHDVTAEVARVVEDAGVGTGLCTVFLRHTSASLVIQENADPAVLRDLARWMDRLAPESADYEHDDEGPDDMPGHLRSVVTRTSESIPITHGRLALGTWQAIYVWEHRRSAHRRELVVHVIGST